MEATGGGEVGGRELGKAEAASQETEGERGSLAGPRPGPGQAQEPLGGSSPCRGWRVLSGAREGQCHLAPGNRRHFLGADLRPAVGR